MVRVIFVQVFGLDAWVLDSSSVSSQYQSSRFLLLREGVEFNLAVWLAGYCGRACTLFVCMVVLLSGIASAIGVMSVSGMSCSLTQFELNQVWKCWRRYCVINVFLSRIRDHIVFLRSIRWIADCLSCDVGVKGMMMKLCFFKVFSFMPYVLPGCVVNPILPLSIDLVDHMCVKNLIGGW